MTLETALRRNRFLVMGRGAMDLYADPPGTRIEDAQTYTAMIGGSAANTAVALSRQGAHAALLTTVSDDAVGGFVTTQLRHYGVDPAHVTVRGGALRTQVSVVETRGDDTRAVLYRNQAADFQMVQADVARVPFADYGVLITAGTVFAAEPARGAAFKAFDLARAAGLPIVFDVDYRAYSWASVQEAETVLARAGKAADIIVGNDVEFGFMAGDYDKGLALARSLAATSAQIVVYKMGAKGAITFRGTDEIRTGIFAVNALKPTGAGDSFMGGFLAALARGQDLKTALLRGTASAAIVVGTVGCAAAMPDTAALDAFLNTHPGPTEA